MPAPTPPSTLAALKAHQESLESCRVASLFEKDATRFASLSLRLDDLLLDFSKHRVTRQTMSLLRDLAKSADVEGKRARLLAGEKVNNTEGRPAMHMALRDFSASRIMIGGEDMRPAIEAERAKCFAFAEALRGGRLTGGGSAAIDTVVNIGIGGSDLGPAMAVRALSPFAQKGLKVLFVSNVDGADLADTLAQCDPARTLFTISSKTFTTLETMTNARSARGWIEKHLGLDAVPLHFAAVSTNLPACAEFGIQPDRIFGFWDWVGGRYSIWSSIGLPLMIAIGPEHFTDFLRGGHDMDRHFADAPLDANIPVTMALLGIWHRNVCGNASHAVIAYDQRLSRFAAYLQQLDMESNGKSVTQDGVPVAMDTAPVIWGEPGTNGQHAFFQMLHQGTSIVPIDFLVAAKPLDADEHHHALLVANCFAQSEALMRGRSTSEAREAMIQQGKSAAEAERLATHKTFPGDRPSSTLLYEKLDPRTLGRLIALYEHKVFVQGAIWDINSFDQWGVELGKELASRLAPIVASRQASTDTLDGSTAGLIAHRRKLA